MLRRVLSFMLTLMLLSVGVSALAETNQFGWEVPEETLKVSMFYNSDQFTLIEEQKVGVAAMQAYLLENFNIDYQCMTSDGTADEDLNLMLAAGTYPGVIMSASTINRQKFVDQGRAVNITEYLMKSENLLGRLDDLVGLYADNEGQYYYLPSSFDNLMDLPDYSAHIRYDEWVEIGSPKIDTPEDYYNAIMAIYELHPTTASGDQRYTLSFYTQGLPEYISGYWGLQRGWKVNDEDNTLTYWTHTDEGKAMAKFFSNWWRTGTMDPDSFTNIWNDLRTTISQERVVGLIGGWWIGYNAGHEIWSLTDDNWFEEKRFVQVGFKAETAENAYVSMKNNAGSSWTIITDACEDPEGVMKWLDFTVTDLGIALTNWGMPGEIQSHKDPDTTISTWTLTGDGGFEFDATAKEQFIAETWDYNDAGVFGGDTGLFSLVNYQGRFEDGVHCIWTNQMWYSENKWKNIMFENMAGTIFDGTALLFESLSMDEDVTFAKTAITDAWKQYYPLVVMSDSDEAFENAWLELQAAVENVGLDVYAAYRTQNYQNNLDLMK